jgi:hypothetical protein
MDWVSDLRCYGLNVEAMYCLVVVQIKVNRVGYSSLAKWMY